MAEELQPVARREIVALLLAGRFLEHDLGAESAFHRLWRPGSGMERAGDEFPERLEILERRAIRIVIMRRGVVQVGGEPQRVANAGLFHE